MVQGLKKKHEEHDDASVAVAGLEVLVVKHARAVAVGRLRLHFIIVIISIHCYRDGSTVLCEFENH